MTRFAFPGVFVLAVAVSLSAACPAAAAEKMPEPAAAAASAEAEAAYTRAIEKRADDILAALALDDPAKAARVRGALLAQYRALRDWHDKNDPELKKLKSSPDKADSQAKVDEIKASLKPIHDGFVERLSRDLTPEQVETVKDKMTYNVVHVTYKGFQEMLPELTEAQKAKILEMLKAGREEAMDGGSSEEKHAIFNRYKGRINNYLAAEGYDLKKASKDWADRRRAAKAARNGAAAAPSEPK